jgi:hypothetical protein
MCNTCMYVYTYTDSGKVLPRLADAGVREKKTAGGEGADAAWEREGWGLMREGWGLIDLPVGKGICSSSSIRSFGSSSRSFGSSKVLVVLVEVFIVVEVFMVLKAQLERNNPKPSSGMSSHVFALRRNKKKKRFAIHCWHACTRTQPLTHSRTRECATVPHTHIHTYTHILTHTHTYSHIHTYEHIHKCNFRYHPTLSASKHAYPPSLPFPPPPSPPPPDAHTDPDKPWMRRMCVDFVKAEILKKKKSQQSSRAYAVRTLGR